MSLRAPQGLAWLLAACISAMAASKAQAALRVDDWHVSERAVSVLMRAARTKDPQATEGQVKAAIVEDHVLGQYAQQHVGDTVLFDDARVGFSLQASSETTLVATLERAWQAELAAALQPDGGQRFIVRRHAVTAARLKQWLGNDTQLTLDDRLPTAHEAALARVALIDYRFQPGSKTQSVSLRDVWQGLDVQGRSVVRAWDAEFVSRQALRVLRTRFVLAWAQTQAGLSTGDVAQLRDLMADRERRVALTRVMGASGDHHYASPEIDRLRQAVTPQEVARYHAQHLDQFQRIERVQARHIRCPDEACAHQARQALQQGRDFADVARQYSVAASAAQGGDLGWIDARQVQGQWLMQLALAQPPGPASPPVREPVTTGQAPGWQIVQIAQRIMGVHEADSETVRFAATQAIAQQRAIAQFEALRQNLLALAHVEPPIDVRPQEQGHDHVREHAHEHGQEPHP